MKAIDLNRAAEESAAAKISQGKVSDGGSWKPPGAEAENAYIEEHGWEVFGMWYLGRRKESEPDTKEHYAFPYSSNFMDVSRPGLNAIRSRAAQNGDEGVFASAGRLRTLLDDREEGIHFHKEEIGTDIFTSSEEAETRAQEIGCEGSHSMEGPDGDLVFMPCKTHDEYEDTIEEPALYPVEDDKTMTNAPIDLKTNLTPSLINPLSPPVESMTTDEVVLITEEEELPIEEKEVEIPDEEVVIEEVVEATEEESIELPDEEVEEPPADLTPDEVLVEVVSVLKSVVEGQEILVNRFDEADEIKALKATIAEYELALTESEAVKTAAEAEALIEAEVQKRVIEVLTEAGASSPSRKSVIPTVAVDYNAKNTFDPSTKASEGMNGLAKWLETQIATR